ncbi:MAG: LytR C-terminal domain-containing protein [bacterium]
MKIPRKYFFYSSIIFICLLALGIAFQSCSFFEYIDGSSEKEIKQFREPKKELRSNIKKLIKSNKDLKNQIKNLEEEKDKAVNEKNILSKKYNELQEEIKREEEEVPPVVEKVASTEDKSLIYIEPERPWQEKVEFRHVSSSRDLHSIKLKVLSGDGNIESAHKMADWLRNRGYSIKLIDYAPRSNFVHNTVYFAANSRKEAEEVVNLLSDNTSSKPISWYSEYDLIVVTGNNP